MSDAYVMPGHMSVIVGRGIVRTLLGSCVAVVIYDSSTRIGGLNHFLLPGHAPGSEASLRFGVHAIPALLAEVQRLGARRQFLEAEIYGGGAVVDVLSNDFAIGHENVLLARRLLADACIPLVAEDVGGEMGRKIEFDVARCATVVRYIASST